MIELRDMILGDKWDLILRREFVIKLLNCLGEQLHNKPSTLNNTNKSSAQEFTTMDTSAKERARQSAIARSKPTNKGTPLSQRQGRTDG